MKNKKDYEEVLLNNKTMDDLIKMKIENEFKKISQTQIVKNKPE